MAKGQTLKRSFNLKNETVEKLTKLRNYHSKTYDSLISIMIDNAFLSIDEKVNLEKGKELEEKNLIVTQQIHTLTLLFTKLEKELAELKTENSNLKDGIAEIKKEKGEISKALNEEILKNKGRSEKYSAQLEKHSGKISALEKHNEENKGWFKKWKGKLCF